MFYKSNIMSVLRAGRKHIKSVTANRGSDFTSTSPLSFMGKMVALSFSDTHTQMTNSLQKVQVDIE